MTDSISQEETYKWQGNVGLISPTDYVKASTNNSCTNVTSYYGNSNCYNTANNDNWLYVESFWWMLSPYYVNTSTAVAWLGHYGGSLSYYYYVNNLADIYPVFYLSSDIVLKGEGTSLSPYQIVS